VNQELERRYRSIVEQYARLLHEWLELSEGKETLPVLLPPFPAVAVVREECPLQGASALSQLLALPGARAEALRELRDFTADTTRLTILDPYFFAGKALGAGAIAQDFKQTARVENGRLRTVHVVRDDRNDTKAVFTSMNRVLRASRVRLTHSATREVHDRVWISDAVRAVVVGTSLNGLGSLAAFILPLPKPDLDAILEFLYTRRLAHRPRRRASR